MSTAMHLKQHIMTMLDTIPDDRLEAVADFVEFLATKHQRQTTTLYTPVALGGIWPDVSISDADLAEVRHEMWRGMGE